MRYLRVEPTTFLKPISLARFTDLAVVRFMKLMQAITRINKAMKLKMCTYSILPAWVRRLRKCCAGTVLPMAADQCCFGIAFFIETRF